MFSSSITYLGVIAVLVCLLCFEAFRIEDLNDRIEVLKGKGVAGSLDQRIAIKSASQAALATQLSVALKENQELRRLVENGQNEPDGPSRRVVTLKDMLRRLPDQKTAALEYAREADWYAAVEGPLDTVEETRGALARIRASAEGRFAKLLHPALLAYLKANKGVFPKGVEDLQPFFAESINPAILQHYKIVSASEFKSVQVAGEWAITQKNLADPEFDTHFVIGLDGWGYAGPRE